MLPGGNAGHPRTPLASVPEIPVAPLRSQILGGNAWDTREPFFPPLADRASHLSLQVSSDYSADPRGLFNGSRGGRGGVCARAQVLDGSGNDVVPVRIVAAGLSLAPPLPSLAGEIAGVIFGATVAWHQRLLNPLLRIPPTPVVRLCTDNGDAARLLRALPSCVPPPEEVPRYVLPLLRLGQDRVRALGFGGERYALVEIEWSTRDAPSIQEADHGAHEMRPHSAAYGQGPKRGSRALRAAWAESARRWAALSEDERIELQRQASLGPICSRIRGLE